MSRPRGVRAAGVLLVVVLALVLVAGPAGAAGRAAAPATNTAAADASKTPVRRVLVVSLPGVSWQDLDLAQLPNLRRLFEQSLVADLSLRGVQRHPSLGDGYVTIGAGARAVSRSTDGGECFQADEHFESGTARAALARRTGVAASSITRNDIACVAQPAIASRNNHLLFDAKVGLLGDTLAANGVDRAAIGNSDDQEPPSNDDWQRSVALALAGAGGTVPDGAVGPELLTHDASQPFGLGMSTTKVLDTFDRAWQGRSVVLVEASDLARLEDSRSLVASSARPALEARVLQQTDQLVGQLLRRVDPAHDAVMVVGTSQRSGPLRLTVASLRAPGLQPGFAVSAYTRHSGVVSIVDIAPTILDQLGIPIPDRMEGRPFEFGRTGGDFASRLDWMVDTNKAAQFRDAQIAQVTTWFVVLQILLTLAAIVAFVWLGKRALGIVEFCALALLGFIPATYLAGLLPFDRWGASSYWAFLLGFSAVFALVIWWTTDHVGVMSLIVALSAGTGLIIVDVATGARLQFDTAFGYSPTVAGRFAGLGNLGYAQLAASAVLLAGLVAFQIGGRRGAWAGIAILVAAIVVDGAPFFGSDVGGTLSMVPAYLVTATLLLGWRFRWRLVAIYGSVALLLLAIFGAIDVSRPKEKQTHLGRLITTGSGSGGTHHVMIVIERKISENASVFFSSVWTIMMPLVLFGIGYLIYRAPGRMQGIYERIPTLSASLIGLAIVAGLGFALNDSGIAIPGVMLGVLTPVLIVITIRGDRQRAAPPSLHDELEQLSATMETRT